jgi:uncharacterized protein
MNPSNTPRNAPISPDVSAVDLSTVAELLDALPDSMAPLDPLMLDGYLCGVLLQPRPPLPAQWLPHVVDIDARPAPPGFPLARLNDLVLRRFTELDRAIGDRQWFDPWIYDMAAEDDSPIDAVQPWVAGFVAAMALFPDLMDLDRPDLVEPLALILQHADAQDLEDADELLAMIATLDPPTTMAEAVEDLVRGVLLIADVTRKPVRARAAPPRRTRTRPGPSR